MFGVLVIILRPNRVPIWASARASPLTFQAIIIWRDELNEGKVLLRDIIDLDATYAGPDAKAMPAPVISPDGQFVVGIAVPNQTGQPPQMQAPVTPPATAIPSKPAPQPTDDQVTAEHGTINESNPDDDDDIENWLSVAAIEAPPPRRVLPFSSFCNDPRRGQARSA